MLKLDFNPGSRHPFLSTVAACWEIHTSLGRAHARTEWAHHPRGSQSPKHHPHILRISTLQTPPFLPLEALLAKK